MTKDTLKLAFDLYKNKDYNDLIELLKPFYNAGDEEIIKTTSYIYASALYKLKNFSEALKVIRNAYLKYHSEHVDKLYALIIFNFTKEKIYKTTNFAESDKNEFLKAIEAIRKLDVSKKFLIGSLIVYFLETVKPGSNILTKNFLHHLINNYDDSFFDKEIRETQNGNKINSTLVRFYYSIVKHLYALKEYYDLINFASEILKKPNLNFVNKLDYWINYHIFLSYIHLKNKEKAFEFFKLLIKDKVQWYYYKYLAILYKSEDNNLFLQYNFLALDIDGISSSKINVLKEITDFIKDTAIKNNIYEVLKKIHEFLKVQDNRGAVNLYKKVRSFLKDLCIGNSMQTGIIKKIKYIKDNSEFIGFISTTNNSYFFHSKNVEYSPCKINDRVRFYLIDSYDKKKDNYSKEAIFIEPIMD